MSKELTFNDAERFPRKIVSHSRRRENILPLHLYRNEIYLHMYYILQAWGLKHTLVPFRKFFFRKYFAEMLLGYIFGPSVVKYGILSDNRHNKLQAVIDCLFFNTVKDFLVLFSICFSWSKFCKVAEDMQMYMQIHQANFARWLSICHVKTPSTMLC